MLNQIPLTHKPATAVTEKNLWVYLVRQDCIHRHHGAGLRYDVKFGGTNETYSSRTN